MKKIWIILAVIIVLPLLVLTVVLATFDADKYRPQLVEILSKQTGRNVKLGPIKLGLSSSGAKLTIENSAIGNPSWASRPEMAGIGRFELGISLLPLLSHEIDITQLSIANADIQLETGANGQNNWDMKTTQQGKADDKAASASNKSAVVIHADHVSIIDSQLAMRDKNGKTSIFKTKNLTYGVEHGGIAVHFDGDYNNAPLLLDVKTNTPDLMRDKDWQFNTQASYTNYQLKAKGTANYVRKTAKIPEFAALVGNTDLQGNLAVAWGSEHPQINGKIISNKINLADFTAPSSEENGEGTAEDTHSSSGQAHVFSDAPLPFSSLKSADANLELEFASIEVGNADLTQFTSKIELANGHLNAPIKAQLGKGVIGGVVKIDAEANPPQVAATFTANGVDLGEILAIAKAPAFLSGSANADLAVTTAGYTMHHLAGGANGKLDIIADGGKVSSGNAGDISSGLMQLFAPKGNNALNCLAARFNITNGIVKDNGILADTAATTVAGKGGFNLLLETIDLTLHAKPKLVNLGGALPPLQVGGTFTSPHFDIDSAAVVQNVAGILTSGSISGITSSGVPDIASAPGQNACVYTLDHPTTASASTTSSKVLVPGVSGQIQKLKDSAPALLKGLLGQ